MAMENENETRSPTSETGAARDYQGYGSGKAAGNNGTGKAETGGKAEGRTPHADKLKTETSRSEAMRGKYRTGKKTDGKTKLKKTGAGKKKSLLKPKIGLPSPPPPGSLNFTGNEHSQDNNAAEDIRDKAGTVGVLALSARKAFPKRVAHYHAPERDWKQVMENRRPIPRTQLEADGSTATDTGSSGIMRGQANQRSVSDTRYAERVKMSRARQAYTNAAEEETVKTELSNSASREIQKKMTRREMMSSARAGESQGGSTGGTLSNIFTNIGEKIENVAQKVFETVVMAIKENPILLALLGVVGVVILIMTSMTSMFGLIVSGGGGSITASSFTAKDVDIVAVEAKYQELEQNLQDEMDKLKDNHPGFDEYKITIADISHDPYELAALLTVLHESYTPSSSEETLQTVIDRQYTLTTSEKTEKRKKKETRWHYVTKVKQETRYRVEMQNGKPVLIPYVVDVEYQELESYEVWVEYDYKIFTATLSGKSINDVVEELGLTEEQKHRYQLLLLTKGNREDLFE